MVSFLQDYSIEVMPRTAEKVDNFKDLLPSGTRVYVAHIEGTPIEDMVSTAKRLNADGFKVMRQGGQSPCDTQKSEQIEYVMCDGRGHREEVTVTRK